MDPINCPVCERRCLLSENLPGACGLYEVKNSHIVQRFADQYLVACPISIETMPILHFHPGAKFLQITTTGCNFNCPGCISTVLVREMFPHSTALQHLSPEQIITKAIENQCEGIVFLMNDPLAAFPSFLKIARLAKAKHLKIGCSSNTYFTKESLSQLIPYLDFINIGMKGFSDTAYQACGVPNIGPVLRNLKTLFEAGVHIEISCILTRDNQSELICLAQLISGISRRIPFQVMRFLPFETASITQEPGIPEAENFCNELKPLLDFVYLFNTPGSNHLHTFCPLCNSVVIRRDFYGPMGAKIQRTQHSTLQEGRCASCGHEIQVVGPMAESGFQEADFQGGYPLTRAMEMVEAMLIAMGVRRKATVVQAWETILQKGGLNKLHQDIQHPRAYIDAIRHFGKHAQVSDGAEALATYLENRLAGIRAALTSVTRHPRVYYAMGKPLFYINGGRLENQLVETAGGVSVNRELPPGGRPGRTLSVSELNRLNPDIIFISAFISNSVDDFHAECVRKGITVNAVENKQIFTHPFPGWDFGSPRWILGLMYMASVFHPDHCTFDVMAEADTFYRNFYGISFDPLNTNRSFSKPNSSWQWQER